MAQRPVSLPWWLGREKPQGFSCLYVSKGGGQKARERVWEAFYMELPVLGQDWGRLGLKPNKMAKIKDVRRRWLTRENLQGF